MKRILLSLVLFSLFNTATYSAEVFIGVHGKVTSKVYSARLASFKGPADGSVNAEDFQNIVRSDLYLSRYFDIKESPENAVKFNKDGLPDYSRADSQYIITGEFSTPESEGRWIFTGTLYDVKGEDGKGRILLKKKYKGGMKALRPSAHLFSDAVVEKITGNKGIAHSRITFSNDSVNGKKEIFVADYDGGNLKKITSDQNVNILPKWSRDGSRIYYTTYKYGNPDIYEINFKQGKINKVYTKQGLNVPGNTSPDDLKLIMVSSPDRNDPGIYTLDLTNNSAEKLMTGNNGLVAAPSWSPDGKKVAFTSDKSGNPQIHIYNTETKKTIKLTKMNWCDSPVWSPDGERIVFAGRDGPKEKFNIFVSDAGGSKIVRLTLKQGHNRNPVWSPDGRFIAFTSDRDSRDPRKKQQRIYIMDADGSAQHLLVDVPGNSYTPSWSN
jgi:TolB protein